MIPSIQTFETPVANLPLRWHEHDPLELISSVEQCIQKACEEFESQGHTLDEIKAVGITNQRETTCVWDSKTGEPLHRAIVGREEFIPPDHSNISRYGQTPAQRR